MKQVSIIFFILLFPLHLVSAQELKIEFKEQLVIGDDENKPEEYLFYDIKNISTDNDGNIYVSDANTSKIKVFDKNGNFIKSIGKKGKGPGEMAEVSCMVVNSDDQLVVVDRLSRRVTVFSDLGEKFHTYPVPEQPIFNPWAVFPFEKNSYVFFAYQKSGFNKETKNGDNIFHIYNKDFSKIENTFGKSEDIWDLKKIFQRRRIGHHISDLCVVNSKCILFAPFIYRGLLYLYENKNKRWQLQLVHGKPMNDHAVELLNASDFPDFKFPPGTLISGSPEGVIVVKVNYASKGLFTMNDGKTVHFSSMRKKGNKFQFGIELFDKKQRYMGYASIKKDFPVRKVLWKDKNDKFYVHSAAEGFSVIRVMKLKIN